MTMSEREETKRCPDCGSKETARHTFEECCTILREQRDEARREREVSETAHKIACGALAESAEQYKELRTRAERMESQIDAVRSLCDDMQDYTAFKVLELLDDASAGES